MPRAPFMMRTVSHLHVRLFKATGGRFGSRIQRLPMLLLSTKGHKSGRIHTTPLGYLPDGDDLVVIASNGGRDYHPAWYRNIQANAHVLVQTRGEEERRVAIVASADEKARFWPRILAIWGGYGKYREKTQRDIPLVILRKPATNGAMSKT
jgi:deazaflavin-dependent oxidoreductase (nitroreductase family)